MWIVEVFVLKRLFVCGLWFGVFVFNFFFCGGIWSLWGAFWILDGWISIG